MHKIALVIATAFIFTSCQNACDIKEDIGSLKADRDLLQMQISNQQTALGALQLKYGNLQLQRSELDSVANYIEGLRTGKTRYVLSIKGKQSRFSLDLGEHAKDAMNAFTFDIPVDAVFYKSVSIGTELVDDFRSGSFIMNGSFGSMKLTVINKRIEN